MHSLEIIKKKNEIAAEKEKAQSPAAVFRKELAEAESRVHDAFRAVQRLVGLLDKIKEEANA